MISKDKVKKLLIEYLTNQKSVSENSEDKIKNDIELIYNDLDQSTVDQYIKTWQTSLLVEKNKYNADLAWDELKDKACFKSSRNKQPSYSFIFKNKVLVTSLAAAFALLITISGLYFFNEKLEKSRHAFSEYYVPYGSRSKISLPDGTDLWLNSGSTIKYTSDYNHTSREVELEGEAFFEVKKNPEKPFYVKTIGATVRVLGTKFNLKAYPEENVIETTVESGIVAVFNKDERNQVSKKIVLHANEQASLLKKTSTIINSISIDQPDRNLKDNQQNTTVLSDTIILSKNINPDISSSWKEDEWIIDSERLSDFSIKMERRFNIRIHIIDQQIKDYVFSGVLKDENLAQMLEAISQTAPIQYKIKDRDVFLTNRGTK